MPFKSEQPEDNGHATQLCSNASYLMHACSQYWGVYYWEKAGIH